MQPYQAASETTRQSGEKPLNFLNYAGQAAIGGGAASLGSKALNSVVSKVGPWLSSYIPENLAIKGLNKVDPRIGKFIKQAMDDGADFDELKEFLGEKINKEKETTEDRNPIQKYSPELYEFLNGKIKEGLDPIQAGAMAQSDKKFFPIIKKLSEDYKTPFSNLLETVFGKEGRRKEGLKKFTNNMKKRSMLEEERERFDSRYGQMASQNDQENGQNTTQNGKWGQISQALQNMLNS